jgi:acetolactate synthase-1/2/3 large subunit
VTCYAPQDFASQADRLTVDIDEHELKKHRGAILLRDGAEYLNSLYLYRASFTQKNWFNPEGKYVKREYPASGPISVYQLVEALSDLLPEDQLIVTGSSGLAIEAFYQTFRNKRGQRIFHTTGMGAMGYGLPAAVGACMANGRKPTVLFESDGSLMFALPTLATIKALNLPITIIVANNGGYASMRATQRNYFEGRYIATGDGIPDIAGLAEKFGITSFNYDPEDSMLGLVGRRDIPQWPRLINVDLLPNEVLSPKFVSAPPLMKAAA